MSDSPKTLDLVPATTSRRTFLKEAAAAAAGFTIVPRHVVAGSGAVPPSDLLNIAGVGVGGMGRANLINLSSENIVALCDVGHESNWVLAAKGNGDTSCPFEYASRLTATMLLGAVALKAGERIHYDGENMRVTNNPAANEFLTRRYRAGWELT